MNPKKKILIADDDPLLLKALKRRCEAMDLEVRTVVDGIDAVTSIYSDPPDLIVLDIDMPAANGFTVFKKIQAHEQYRHIPMLFLTGMADERVASRCAALGAGYVLKDAKTWENLSEAVKSLLKLDTQAQTTAAPRRIRAEARQSDASQATLLAVDDDADILNALKIQCEAVGLRFISAGGSQDGFAKALQEKPDVIISDYMMPDGSGLYFIQRLRNSFATKEIPVIVLTGKTLEGSLEDNDLVMRIRRQEGVIAYLHKPLEFETLYDVLKKAARIPLGPMTMQTRRAAKRRTQSKKLFGS